MKIARSEIAIREWRDGDEQAVDAILDREADSIWRSQFQTLHGKPIVNGRFSRTFVATLDEEVVGIATVATSGLHPGRYTSAIEVRPDRRQSGIGTHLLDVLMLHRPEPKPLATKIVAANSAALAFARARGGRVYQTAPLVSVNPSSPATKAWVAEKLLNSRFECSSLGSFDIGEIANAFSDLYLWMHEQWSPVGSIESLKEIATAEAISVDRHLSSAVTNNDQIDAVAIAFRGESGVEIVAETTRRDTRNGLEMLGVAVALALESCAAAGIDRVEFDGHVDDPHLAPVLESLPESGSNPLFLMEFVR